MDIIVIFNGLGNQMSQYAFYLAKKERNKNCYYIFDPKSKNEHNGLELNKLFNIEFKKSLLIHLLTYLYLLLHKRYINKILNLLGIRIIYEAKNYDYNSKLKEKGPWGVNFYWGGWHSEKNFIEIKETIKNVYLFNSKTEDTVFDNWVHLIQNDYNSVSLHVRRGDYLNVTPNDFYQFNNVATVDYYNKAIQLMKTKLIAPTFYVFSNDINWCKEVFQDENFKFIDCNKLENSWRDMYLMSLCHHHITANSTFSWWGAWLSNYKDSITICPKKFIRTVITKDIYPENWIKL